MRSCHGYYISGYFAARFTFSPDTVAPASPRLLLIWPSNFFGGKHGWMLTTSAQVVMCCGLPPKMITAQNDARKTPTAPKSPTQPSWRHVFFI